MLRPIYSSFREIQPIWRLNLPFFIFYLKRSIIYISILHKFVFPFILFLLPHLSWSEPLYIFNSWGLCPSDMFLLYYASCLFSASVLTDLPLSFSLAWRRPGRWTHPAWWNVLWTVSFLTGLRGQNVLKRVASQVCLCLIWHLINGQGVQNKTSLLL